MTDAIALLSVLTGASIESAIIILLVFACGVAWGLYRGADLWRDEEASEI